MAGAVACTMMLAALGLSLVAFWQLLALPPDARAFDVTVAQWIPSIPLQMWNGAVGASRCRGASASIRCPG